MSCGQVWLMSFKANEVKLQQFSKGPLVVLEAWTVYAKSRQNNLAYMGE